MKQETLTKETSGGTVILQGSDDPWVFDAEGNDVTFDVYKIEILPGCKVLAYPYATNEDGKHYMKNKAAAKARPFQITKISGEFSR